MKSRIDKSVVGPKIIEAYLSGKTISWIMKNICYSRKIIKEIFKKYNLKLRESYKDLSKEKFGKLQPISVDGDRNRRRRVYWNCLCDCGNTILVMAGNLQKGHTKSCGCIQKAKNKNNKKWKGIGDISGSFFCHIKNGAKSRNLEFNITIEYIWNLFLKQDKKCIYTGLELEFAITEFHRAGEHSTASLDRIDNNKGYIEGNVQWVHQDINYMRQNLKNEKFFNYCKLICLKNNLMEDL